jgi:hypothetical protein
MYDVYLEDGKAGDDARQAASRVRVRPSRPGVLLPIGTINYHLERAVAAGAYGGSSVM